MLVGLICVAQSNLTGNALLDELQHRAVNFFWEQSNPKTGFSKDRATNLEASDKYDVASSASTGFALVAYPIGVERKWLDREQARQRTITTLRSMLDLHAGHKGWYYHFTNWETGARVWNCELSSIDTSIFLAGVIAAERYWKDKTITELTDKIMGRIDWKWMMTDGGEKPKETAFSMGWNPEKQTFIEARWNGYYEHKMLLLQAYGYDPKLDASGFDTNARDRHDYGGYAILNGGPLFIHQMSESFYSFSNLRDRRGYNYWVETKNATLGNRQYCIDNPKQFKDYGPDFWGLSACDTPDGYDAVGAPPSNDNGTITPTSAIASMPYTPKESMAFAEAMYRDHRDAWGRYGFSNGVNPSRNWVDPDVIGIDLGMMLCGVENYRTGMIWKLSKSNPKIVAGYARMGFIEAPGSNQGPLQTNGK